MCARDGTGLWHSLAALRPSAPRVRHAHLPHTLEDVDSDLLNLTALAVLIRGRFQGADLSADVLEDGAQLMEASFEISLCAFLHGHLCPVHGAPLLLVRVLLPFDVGVDVLQLDFERGG